MKNHEADTQMLTNPDSEHCVFCGILTGERPGRIIYSDERVTAFWDAQPAAKLHILIVPNQHIPSINALRPADEALIGHMILVARQVAAAQNVDQHGYRLIINTGRQAGQTIDHLHLHLLSGMITHSIG